MKGGTRDHSRKDNSRPRFRPVDRLSAGPIQKKWDALPGWRRCEIFAKYRRIRPRFHRAIVSALTTSKRHAHPGHEARSATRNAECSVRVLERWSGALLLERRNLLPQGKVFNHKIGSTPTDRTGAERDVEDENTEHDHAVRPSSSVISSRGTARKSLISHAGRF